MFGYWIAWMLWKLGGIDGDPVLRGTRIRAKWEYVSSVEGGQLGMVDLCVICGCGESTCTIAWSPPSTTYDGYAKILQAWSEKVWKSQSSYFYSLTTEWYLEICRGGQETLGTSGGVLLPKTKLDQSRPNSSIVSQWEPVTYLNRQAPGSQPIKEQRPQSKEACVVVGQQWILSNIWNMAPGNRLQRVCNRLQGLKMGSGSWDGLW